ncbi:MAG: HAMP domain-containing histidine kinase, partial [Cyclobacteriaceae bacterium]|nr:HAMP domain-containing histidine kinase [Cyclobacteriaceae bacterium]
RKAEVEVQEQRDVLARIDRATSMGQLTGSIAHELNQPLTGILGNAQASEMMLKNETFDSKELLEIMGDIVSDTKRAGDVIRNLRDLYKDQKNIEFSIIDINAILDETLLLLHSELVKYDVKVKRINESDTPEINGNKVQIQQVIVNLIMNAIEAMSSIDTQYFILTITTKYSDSEVKVYIDDLGPGIDEDKIDQIFQPLATWKSGGTGMGLAISNSIIESHGGRMVAENLSGGGARVGFEIPIINKN